MKIQIPEKANEIITTLTAAGYEAYVVAPITTRPFSLE